MPDSPQNRGNSLNSSRRKFVRTARFAHDFEAVEITNIARTRAKLIDGADDAYLALARH